jgi:hypothetical protein
MKMKTSISTAGVDVHYKFSKVALCDERGQLVRRERLDHVDRDALRRRWSQWPANLTAVMEASFGWGWLSDVMTEAGIDVRLSNCFKVEKMRKWRAMFDHYTDGGRTNRNRGYIKVARELVKVIFVVWSKNVNYTDTPPSRPGRSKITRKKKTRSGTGQFHRPMVVAG